MKKPAMQKLTSLALVLVMLLTLFPAAFAGDEEITPCETHDFVEGVCSVCGAKEPAPVCEHVYEDGVCSVCGAKEPAPICEHVYEDGVCSVCGAKEPAPICEHVYEDGVCTLCGAKEPEPVCEHVYEDGVCGLCGAKEPAPVCEHVYEDGVCGLCGAKEPEPTQKPEPSEKPETSAAPAGSDSKSDGGVTVNASWGEDVFPAGTTMSVSCVGRDAALAMAAAAGIEALDGEAVDISFFSAEGDKIQPAEGKTVSVSITLGRALEGSRFTLLHQKAAQRGLFLMKARSAGGEVETVGSAGASAASFAGGSFSVYAIVGENYAHDPQQQVRWTYEFYVGTTKVNSQIVKNGDSLYEPSAPDAGTNQRFAGWRVQGETGYLDFSQPVSVTGTADQTIHVDAVFETVYHIEYRDLDGNVIRTDEAAENSSYTFDPDDPLFDTQDLNKINAGWKDQNNVTHTTDTITVSEDLTLTPDLIPGFFARFFTQGGSFVESQPLGPNELVTQPADPTRKGYAFAGWYTSADGEEAFDFSTPPNTGVDIYAHWTPAETSYVLVFMLQDAEDAELYTFHSSYVKSGVTGTQVTIDDADKEYAAMKVSGIPFYFYGGTDPATLPSIEADGSTVVTVLCDRFYYNFTYNNSEPVSIRWGQTLKPFWEAWGIGDKTFENGYQTLVDDGTHSAAWMINYFPEKTTVPASNSELPSPSSIVTFARQTSHALDPDEIYELGYTFSIVPTYIAGPYHYLQITWRETINSTPQQPEYAPNPRYYTLISSSHEATPGGDSAQFYYQYTERNGEELSSRDNPRSVTFYGYKNPDEVIPTYHYYGRQRYDIKFYDDSATPVLTEEDVFYEYPLAGFEPDSYEVGVTEKEKDGITYRFTGWYRDEAATEPLDWATAIMPAANLALYAGWSPITSTVTFDPNGGTLTGPEKVTLPTGQKVSQPTDPTPGEAGAVFLGWTHNGKTYDFSSPVAEDITLVAQWSTSTVYTVAYDPGTYGTFNKADGNSYIEGASAVVLGAPTVTDETKVFLGWQIKDPNSRSAATLLPGESFTIDSADANTNKVITLVAVYGNKPGLTSIRYEPNGGVGTAKNYADVGANNDTTEAKSLANVGFEAQSGYAFVCWNTKADGTGESYEPGETVALNSTDGVENVLYAKWAPILEVELTGSTLEKVYNGGEQSNEGYTVVYKLAGQTVTSLPEGVTATLTATQEGVTADPAAAKGTDVGSYTAALTLTLSKTAAANVVLPERAATAEIVLIITPKPVTLRSATLTKMYDGKPLTNGTTPLAVEEGWIAGETVSYKFTGSQTKVGSSDNSFEVLWNGTAKEKNYTVTITPGKLIVTRNPDVPSTGDGTNLPLWAGLLLASTLALAAALRGLSAPKKRGRHSA